MKTNERNYRKNPHTANFLMTFHTAGGKAAPQKGPDMGTKDMSRQARAFDLATAKQADYAIKLSIAKGLPRIPTREEILKMDRRVVSQVISELQKRPNKDPEETTTAKPFMRSDTKVTEDGIYVSPDGEVFKVQWNKAGGTGRNLYAKQLTVEYPTGTGQDWVITQKYLLSLVLSKRQKDQSTHTWVYTPGAINLIEPTWKLDSDTAKKFGDLYGTCVRCLRPLTDEESIAAGMGPICRNKL